MASEGAIPGTPTGSPLTAMSGRRRGGKFSPSAGNSPKRTGSSRVKAGPAGPYRERFGTVSRRSLSSDRILPFSAYRLPITGLQLGKLLSRHPMEVAPSPTLRECSDSGPSDAGVVPSEPEATSVLCV
jgi:hypothetical protein